MNALFQFYLGVKRIIREATGHDWLEASDLLKKSPSIRNSSSWKPNEDKIKGLCQIYADPTRREAEQVACEFLLAAMKDLLTMKNPQAHSLFEELKVMFFGEKDSDRWVFIWARKVKNQGKECRVMTIHTSGLLPKNLGDLRTLIDGGLEGGIVGHHAVL